MKTLTLAAIRCSLMFTAVAALSLAYPASVQAVPTTYHYIGNPFTEVVGPSYTTSDFVTAMITLAGPLGANMPLTEVTPIAFTLSDGVQTITNNGPGFVFFALFLFATDASGAISMWSAVVENIHDFTSGAIVTNNDPTDIHDSGIVIPEGGPFVFGANELTPGEWSGPSRRRTRGLPYH
jgi:hypothetical protein